MRTQDVKVNQEYLYNDVVVTVIKRIKGRETTQRNMQSGVMFIGYVRTPKKFLLSNGETVYAKHLSITKI